MKRQTHRIAKAAFEALETRRLMCTDHELHLPGLGTFPTISETLVEPIQPPLKRTTKGARSGGPVADLPVLDSNPDATAQLYLDFDGASSMSWAGKTTGVTPAYDTDGNAASFTAGEITNIESIFERVAEAYSPFDINVTTVDPGNLDEQVTTRVVVGGTGSWFGSAGGVAFVGGFYNGASNVCWVFPKMLSNGNVKFTADAIEHEAGHTFGLQHQSTYSGSTKTNEYNPGTSAKAPVMGNSYGATRSLWWNGTSSVSSSTIQNDVTVLSGASNNFGYRDDEAGSTTGTATALDIEDDTATASGIITTITDTDYFSFDTLAGDISFTVSPAAVGGMLDAKLSLVDSGNNVVTSADTSSLGETINASVSTGTYYVVISSKGNAGDIGQFSLTGTVITSPDYVARPADLTATADEGDVEITWTDRSGNETGFRVERSDDGGSTWDVVTTTSADAESYTDDDVDVGSSYKYRVRADGSVQNSTYTSTVTVNVVPATPASPSATSVSATQIDLSWTDGEGETGYRIDRSVNGTTWTTLTTTDADEDSYASTGLSATTKYYYRVVALSGVGNSTPSATVNATTTPTTPATITGSVTTSAITISWTNVAGETGYRLERSSDGVSFTQLIQLGANVAGYVNSGLATNARYYYRVKAIGTGGDSPASTVINKTTLLNPPANVQVYGPTATSVKVSWSDTKGETGYKLEKLTGTTWSQVGSTLAANTVKTVVSDLTAGMNYSFRVSATNDGGTSAVSAIAKGSTLPPAPTTVTASALSSDSIQLTWSNVALEAAFRIERSSDGGSTWTWVGVTAADILTFTDYSLAAGTTYHYRIKGLHEFGTGVYSSSANATTLA